MILQMSGAGHAWYTCHCPFLSCIDGLLLHGSHNSHPNVIGRLKLNGPVNNVALRVIDPQLFATLPVCRIDQIRQSIMRQD